MLENDFFSLFTDHLDALEVEYMVTGSVVVIAYGEPRLTNDIDLVIDARGVLAVSGDLVDHSILEHYVNEFHLHSAWHSLKVD